MVVQEVLALLPVWVAEAALRGGAAMGARHALRVCLAA